MTVTYGDLAFRNNRWLIKAQPHVMLRLKRVFPKIAEREHGLIHLHANVEVARDLEWFIERYPLAVDETSKRRLRRDARKHREQETLLSQLLSGVQPPLSFPLALPARDYQREAATLAMQSGGLLLADDVGLGKTCVAICVMVAPESRPALVVTLTHLPQQWQNEIKKFAPGLTTHILKQGTPYDLRAVRPGQPILDGMPLPDIIISNYHKLSGWAETLAPIIKTVIFDEGQELRHEGSNKASAARHLSRHARIRMACTATPIYNYGAEMFNVIECVRPGALGSRDEFLQEWCGRSEKIKDPAAFGTYARAAGLMLRRSRKDVGRELPALTKIPHDIACDTEKLDEVQSTATELAKIILAQTPQARGEKFRAAEELSVLLRQATGIAKAPFVADFVRILVANGEKVVLYGWHRAVYDIWLERLKDLNPVMYTGTESPVQKQESFRRFANGDSKVLVMSLRAGAGLDGLQQHTRTVVFGELDWSPGVHEQCCGRVHRDGQDEPVVAYFLITDSGSDPVVADVLGIKAEQIAGIKDPDRPLVEKLQADGEHIRRLAEMYLRKVAA